MRSSYARPGHPDYALLGFRVSRNPLRGILPQLFCHMVLRCQGSRFAYGCASTEASGLSPTQGSGFAWELPLPRR